MIVCRQCQREVPDINQSKFCPFCGAVLPEKEQPETRAEDAPPAIAEDRPAGSLPPTAVAGDDSGANTGNQTAGYVPWEHREQLGFLQAFSQTWSDATFHPQQFFCAAPKTGNIGAALLYAFLIGMAASLISSFWQYQLYGSMADMKDFERVFGMGLSREMLRYFVLASPFLLILSLFLSSAIFHLCLVLVGSAKNGWEATFRGMCYSYGPQFLSLIPWCGGIIAGIWQLVIMVIGWRELHESTTGRVLLALLLPIFLCCCAATFLIYRFAEWFSRFGAQV